VLLESGAGDVSVIWALVQPRVAAFARVCSYDRGGYAWSDPGARPRSYAQLALELHRVRWSAASAARSGDRPYVTPATHHARHRNGAPRRECIGCAHCADCGTVRHQLGAPARGAARSSARRRTARMAVGDVTPDARARAGRGDGLVAGGARAPSRRATRRSCHVVEDPALVVGAIREVVDASQRVPNGATGAP
jgi:hypothetical protein